MIDSLLKKINNQNRMPIHESLPSFMEDIQNSYLEIKNDWQIFKESTAVLLPIDEISADQAELNKLKKWNALVLYAYGHKNKVALESFSSIASILEREEEKIKMMMFSVLQPGMKIPSHMGNNYHVLRGQLCIENEEPEKTNLKVMNTNVKLNEGDVVVFDDTFLHEAWNNSAKDRVVLIIDFVKPFPFGVNWLNKIMLNRFSQSNYVKRAVANW
jgi:beta-hydroxylase